MAAGRPESPELVEPAPPTRLRFEMLPESVGLEGADDPAVWAPERLAVYIGGPGPAGPACGALCDMSLQSPITNAQLATAVSCISRGLRHRKVPSVNGCVLDSVTVNLVGCAGCALRRLVELTPANVLLLWDPLPCPLRQHKWGRYSCDWPAYAPRSIIVAPRNALEPRYSLDSQDVSALLSGVVTYPGASLSFANFPIRLFDVPPPRGPRRPDADAYFFAQWCVNQCTRTFFGRRGWIYDVSLELHSVARPADVVLGFGELRVAVPRVHGPGCKACADRPSFLGLADLLSLWREGHEPKAAPVPPPVPAGCSTAASCAGASMDEL
jgi:hypothetical protein